MHFKACFGGRQSEWNISQKAWFIKVLVIVEMYVSPPPHGPILGPTPVAFIFRLNICWDHSWKGRQPKEVRRHLQKTWTTNVNISLMSSGLFHITISYKIITFLSPGSHNSRCFDDDDGWIGGWVRGKGGRWDNLGYLNASFGGKPMNVWYECRQYLSGPSLAFSHYICSSRNCL